MRRAMRVLADKYRKQEEAKGRSWTGGKNRAAYYRWFLRQMIAFQDQGKPGARSAGR